MIAKINKIQKQAIELISQCTSMQELEQVRIRFLGRKGELNQAAKLLPNMNGQEKKQLGQAINKAKNLIKKTLQSKKNSSKHSNRTKLNLDQAAHPINQFGHLHIVTQAMEEITRIFAQIGFERVRHPEVDWDWYAFESLNMPAKHPARDEWETLFVDSNTHPKYGKMVLTPHTSNGQVRQMIIQNSTPPIRIINIAKCYRRQQDITHTVMFHQFEGLLIDKNIHIGHLKGVFDYFAINFYGSHVKSRIRPFNFCFTEPSFEVDFSCSICEGKGCKSCKSGWHEVGGAGMVHPNVLKAGGINPDIYSGFAFGWGIERTYMMKSGIKIPDIRILYQNDIRFLEQF